MSWPLPQDYNEAIQNPRSSFSDPDLQWGVPVANPLGIPLPRSGNFADVYELRCPGGDRWAAKCFTREVHGLRERYAAISRHLSRAQLPFIVDFDFQEQGIRVRGQWYPVLKMPWIEGLTLNEFVRQYADRPPMLKNLLLIWVRMAARLRDADIAHADLQHGNVLLVPGSTANSLAVKLVDYDGMWVPALAGSSSGEVGHPCYQHPQRLAERTYNQEVDRFPLLLVATALSCLEAGGRALWEKYDSGDNLLFREADLQAPSKSPLFHELLKLSHERAPRLVRQMLDALKGRLEAVPLLEEVLPELQAPPPPRPAIAPVAQKRTSAVKPPVAQPVAQPAEVDSPWDLGGEDRPRPRRRRGSKAGCTSVAVTMLIVVLGLAGGLVALAFRGEKAKPKDKTGTDRQTRTTNRDANPPRPGGVVSNSLGMKFAWCPPGHFLMGSPVGEEEERSPDETPHRVTLTKGFYLGIHEVTQGQWKAVMGNNPSGFQGDDLPVEQVSWEDCQEFCAKLARQDGKRYRLPTEAEWEYACRAGSTTPFFFGATIGTYQANYDGTYTYGNGKKGVYREQTTPVGSFPSNTWGLFDMHGNVWEWCADGYGDYPAEDVTDPQGGDTQAACVIRGGSWNSNPCRCRSALRHWKPPGTRSETTGCRVVLCLD
jgi:formylglycine-generating enzyme required for sulfatase activity